MAHFERERNTVGKIYMLLRGINIHPAYLLLPVGLSLAAAVFEGASIGLLIPLINGFLSHDFSFLMDVPVVGSAIRLLPDTILHSDRLLFAVLLLCFVTSVLLKNILKYLSVFSMAYFSQRALHHLRKQLFGRYLQFGKLYFDKTSVGQHSVTLSEFAYQALWPILGINKHVNAFFSLVAYLIVMSLISWQLTTFAIPLFIFLHFCMKYIIRKIHDLSYDIAKQGGKLGKKAVEILSTMPLVKAYGMEENEKKHFAKISDEKAKLDFQSMGLRELMLPFQESVTLVAVALIVSVMLYLMISNQSGTAPAFIVYFYVIINAASKFGTLTGFRGVLASAVGPLKEVCAIFDDDDKHTIPSGHKIFTGLNNSVEFKSLSFSYPDTRDVLRSVSFSVSKGEMTAIVGPTGSGKSTLIHLLMRYYDCRSGQIFLDGTDIRLFSIPSLLRHFALVSQETLLLHESLRKNITYGLSDISDEQLQDAIRRARLEQYISQLPDGLETLIGDRGVKLSGGEKQRVSIARALLKGAEILILDEATSALDSQTEKLIQEAIDAAVVGRTSIVIAHRLSTIQNADKIVVIDDGKVVEQGTLNDLINNNGKFYALWKEQKF